MASASAAMRALRVEVVLDGKGQGLAALALERGDLEMSLDLAVGSEEVGDALGALGLVDQVDLVEHQPARLSKSSASSYLRNSSTMARASRTGSTAGSSGARSTR